MTTTMGYNTEDLKRKLDDGDIQGPIQKILKRSSPSCDQLFSQDHFSYGEEEDDFFEDDNIFNDDDSIQESDQQQQKDHQEQEQQQQQQPTAPQRKKPGRKPNPASPALRKAQNRAAQRAFRERKERHLRELENTIKTLRENQYETLLKSQRDYTHLRSLIEQLEAENSFLKEIAFTFECALNSINGNNDATTKMKNALSHSIPTRSASLPINGNNNNNNNNTSPFGIGSFQLRQASLPSQQQQQSIPTAQQIENTFYGLFQPKTTNFNIPSPATSNVMMSPGISTASVVSASSSPPTPKSINLADSISPSSTFFAEEFAREITLADMKPFVTPSPSNNINQQTSLFPDNICSSQLMTKSNSNSSDSFMAEAASMIDNEADLFSAYILNEDLCSTFDNISNFDLSTTPDQNIVKQQILRLSKKIGQTIPGPVIPKTKYPLTQTQISYLTVPHDPRIDMIPCLHLRSRMIQYQNQYDLNRLMELLITKAKCHGDPLNPDSWELPDEFFDEYNLLVFQHCRIKSSLYKKYGHLPKDFENFYRKGKYLLMNDGFSNNKTFRP